MSKRAIDPRVPGRANFRIGEVAEIADVEPHVLRYWESEFPKLQPRKTGSGQRSYTALDVTRVLEVRDLLHEQGYTIEGAKRQLKRRDGAELVPARTKGVLEQVRKEVDQLLQLVDE